MLNPKFYTWRQIENSIIYDTFYNLEDLIEVYVYKTEKEKVKDIEPFSRRFRTKEEIDKKYYKLSELLVERGRYNPNDIKTSQLRNGEDTKFTNKKLVISGNIVELYEYSQDLNYDFKSLMLNRKKPYEGLEPDEIEERYLDNQVKSRRRTLKNYKRLINCNLNHFERFFTGTFAPFLEPIEGNFQDLAFTNKEYKEFIKRVKRYFKEVKGRDLDLHYIATVEPQKESTWNFHYHVLCDIPFIENRPTKLKESEKDYINNKLENIRIREAAGKKVYAYEKRLLKLWEYRKQSQKDFNGIGLLDFLWSWGSVDYKRIKVNKKGKTKKEKAYHGKLVDTKQKGLDLGSYMAKNIGDYMIKNIENSGDEGKEFKRKIANKKLYLASTNLKRSIEILDIQEVEKYVTQNLTQDKFVTDFEFENTFISGKVTKYNLNGVYKKTNKKRIEQIVYDTRHFLIMKDELLYRDGRNYLTIKESEYDKILKLEVQHDIKKFILNKQSSSK